MTLPENTQTTNSIKQIRLFRRFLLNLALCAVIGGVLIGVAYYIESVTSFRGRWPGYGGWEHPYSWLPTVAIAVSVFLLALAFIDVFWQYIKRDGSQIVTKSRPHLVPALVAAVMLLSAGAPLPYGYYQFLRWAICGVAIFVAVKAYSWKQAWATWLFTAVAVLFNPLLPITLEKEIWQPIDIATAFLFGLSMLFIYERQVK